jgi:hypothetical protein
MDGQSLPAGISVPRQPPLDTRFSGSCPDWRFIKLSPVIHSSLSGGSPTCIANLARAYVASGKTSEAVKLVSDLKEHSNSNHSHASEIAEIYVALGDTDQAMNWLEKCYEERFNPSALLRPSFDPLRSDPRFKDLLRRIGLPR